MKHTSYIELSKSALNNNIKYLKSLAKERTRFSMVIKANAYGHGIEDLLPMIEECGVDHFSVFSVAEAMRAHKVKRENCEIMIIGWIDDDYIEWAIKNEVSFYVFTFERLHAACKVANRLNKPATLFNFPETAMDLVRIGISSYGFWPNTETKMLNLSETEDSKDPLQRVLSWKSVVMSVKNVAENEYVSYGKSYLTNHPTVIATIPVGYGYGFSRTLSNNGYVLINGMRVRVIGAVNMNMMVVDVTDLDEVKVGDEVVLIGKQGDQTITVSSFSDMNNSMNYELLTRLPSHIPRKIVD